MKYSCLYLLPILLCFCCNAKINSNLDNSSYPEKVESTISIVAIEDIEPDNSENIISINIDSLKIYLSEANNLRKKLEEELKKASPEQAYSIYCSGSFLLNEEDFDHIKRLTSPVIDEWGSSVGYVSSEQSEEVLRLLEEEGFEPEYQGEGYAELRINAYHYYNIFSPYLSEENSEYMRIYAQNDNVITMDAGLIIPLSKLVERCIEWESYLNKYPNAQQRNEVALQYGQYLGSIMFCTEQNTEAFDRNTKIVKEYVLESVKEAILQYPDSEATKIFKVYLLELEKSNYKYSEELEKKIFSTGILKEIDWKNIYY